MHQKRAVRNLNCQNPSVDNILFLHRRDIRHINANGEIPFCFAFSLGKFGKFEQKKDCYLGMLHRTMKIVSVNCTSVRLSEWAFEAKKGIMVRVLNTTKQDDLVDF